ncbi:MAG: EI24 domain-containing protein [Salinivirgaceae bacterium]|nr:EI24 domain-containing protein [Salinivirgaceae bacterium]
MRQFKGISIGFSSFFKAIPFIFKNKLWWTFLIPIALSLTLYIIGFSFVGNMGDWLKGIINNCLLTENSSEFVTGVVKILGGITKLLMQFIFLIIFYYLSGYILLILLSPLFAWISERTDQIINQTDYPFEWKQFFKDIWRGIALAFRNLFYEIAISLIVIIINFIPVINFISAPLSVIFLFLLSSYFYGFSYMDYTSERKKLNAKESIQLIRNNKGMAIANGALFSFSLLIPVLGGITAIIASVGATLAMNEIPEIKNRIIEPKIKKA